MHHSYALGLGLEVIKCFHANSAERDILNAHKYKISINSFFSRSDKPKTLFFLPCPKY